MPYDIITLSDYALRYAVLRCHDAAAFRLMPFRYCFSPRQRAIVAFYRHCLLTLRHAADMLFDADDVAITPCRRHFARRLYAIIAEADMLCH